MAKLLKEFIAVHKLGCTSRRRSGVEGGCSCGRDQAAAELEALQNDAVELDAMRDKLAEYHGGLPDNDASMGLKMLLEQVERLQRVEQAAQEQLEHISLWTSQDHHALDVAQITDAIIRMCADGIRELAALNAGQEKPLTPIPGTDHFEEAW